MTSWEEGHLLCSGDARGSCEEGSDTRNEGGLQIVRLNPELVHNELKVVRHVVLLIHFSFWLLCFSEPC